MQQFLRAEIEKPAATERTVAAAYQAYMMKLGYEVSEGRIEAEPAMKKIFPEKMRDHFPKMTLSQLREMVTDSFAAAHPELNNCAAGKDGPSSLKTQADISVGRDGDIRSFLQTTDNTVRLFHAEHRSMSPSVKAREDTAGSVSVSLELHSESSPTGRQLGNRMENREFFKEFYNNYDKAVGTLRKSVQEGIPLQEIKRELNSVRQWQKNIDLEMKRLDGVRADVMKELKVENLNDYISLRRSLFEFRDEFLKDAGLNTRENRLRYQLREDCLDKYARQQLGEELARQTREKNPVFENPVQVLEFTKREFHQVNHHDYTEENYTDVCYTSFVQNARTDGFSPKQIFAAIESDRQSAGLSHSKMDSRKVITLSSYVDESFINGLDRCVESSMGASFSMPVNNAGLAASYGSFMAGEAAKMKSSLGNTQLADAFIRRMENPELYNVSLETALLNPAVILRDDMMGAATVLCKNGEIGKLGELLRDSGVHFADNDSLQASFGKAAAVMYGKGELSNVNAVEAFRDKWRAAIKSIPKVPQAIKPTFKSGGLKTV